MLLIILLSMRFLLKRILVLAILFALYTQGVFAGDASQVRIIGFSQDGKYMAFEVSGVQDGSGMPYCEIYIVDVLKNDFATRPVKLRGKEFDDVTLASLRNEAYAAVKEQVQRFKIDESVQGQTLVNHPLSDLTSEGCRVSFSAFPGVYPAPPGYKYDIILEERATGRKCFDLVAKMFTLKLKQGEKTKVLQADKRLPASRGCVYKYRIERVVLCENKIAVFLNIFKPGFEGPSIRHMVVTGTLGFDEP